MTITGIKNIQSLSLWIFLLISLAACHEETTACLDITAANYNAAADNDCPENDESSTCVCTFNQLSFDLELIFDTLSYSLNSTYVNDLGDSINVREAHFVFSDFEIINSLSVSNRIQKFADFNNDDVADDQNDLIVNSFSSSIQNVGDIRLKDSISMVSFLLGIPAEYNDANLNFSENEELEEIVDSMYVNDSDQIAFFRLQLWEINIDTIEYIFEYFDDEEMLSLTFESDTIINYDDNIDLELDADINVLFSGVDISAEDAKEKIIQNLGDIITKRE